MAKYFRLEVLGKGGNMGVIGPESTIVITELVPIGNHLKKSSDEYYFNGSISRIRFNYQFNNFLNIRLIAENNSFNEKFFIQPLIQWNPNPSTIFYFGGNQRTVDFVDNEFSRPELLDFNRSQFFLKFQYLIGI